MTSLKRSSIEDFFLASSWVFTQEECDIWSGGKVIFPIVKEQMLEAIGWNDALNWSLTRREELLGVGQLIIKEDQRLHMARIILSPAHRGQGLGRNLVAKMVEAGHSKNPKCLSLNVHPENEKAISLYASLGFRPVMNGQESRNGLFIYMERAGQTG